MTRRLPCAARLLLTVALGVSCGNAGPRIGGRTATKTRGPTVPYTVAEPVSDAPVKATFARSRWMLVDDGASDLRTNIRKPGPALLAHFIDDSRPILYNRLHRLAYRGNTVPFGKAVEVDKEALEKLHLLPPTASVWLIGAGGPCQARVDAPYVGRASRASRTLEISYQLLGCEVIASRWGPAGIVAESLPTDVTWTPVRTTEDVSYTADNPWTHPLLDFASQPQIDLTPTGFVAHVRTVDGPRPGAAQVIVSAVHREPDDPCATQQVHRATTGWWGDRAFDPIEQPWLDAADPPLLLGTLARAGEPQALVFADNLDGFIAVVPAVHPPLAQGQVMQIDPGPETWTRHRLVRGSWTDEERAHDRFSVVSDCR